MRALVVGNNMWTHADLPEPEPRAHDTIVRVHAAGLNRADLDELRGRVQG